MIGISKDSVNIIKARRDFYKKLGVQILDRMDEAGYTEAAIPAPIPRVRWFMELIESYLADILVGEPARLLQLSTRVNGMLAVNNELTPNSNFVKAIEYVFNYNWFIAKKEEYYDAYNLAESLDVNVCVYCNRNYTFTIIKKKDKGKDRKITRPQFDHFFNKADHPLLALSFYNLIPSCSICNSGIKHAAAFDLIHNHHPYIDDFINDFTFNYTYSAKSPSGLKVNVVSNTPKTETSISALETEVIYNSHVNELKDLLDMRYKFSDNYLTIIEDKILTGVRMSKSEIYNLAFGTELEEKKFGNRPFSKFKSDILKQLKII